MPEATRTFQGREAQNNHERILERQIERSVFAASKEPFIQTKTRHAREKARQRAKHGHLQNNQSLPVQNTPADEIDTNQFAEAETIA